MKACSFFPAPLVPLVVLVFFMLPAKTFCMPLFIDSKSKLMVSDTLVPINVKLEKTSLGEMKILFIRDTAAATALIKDIMGRGYGELMQYVQANSLAPLRFMAWYHSTEPPWQVDIAVECDRLPGQLGGRIQSRIVPGGEVIIAHARGPYEQLGQAYAQIGEWLKENNRKAKGSPFEVYLNDPNAVKSPSEIQTDVCQPLE
jgi:effector-binding domain-containing protein